MVMLHPPSSTKPAAADGQGQACAAAPGPPVLQVLSGLNTFGCVERATLDVAASLAAQGHRALVASAGGRLVRELERLGGTHVTLPLGDDNPFTLRQAAHGLADILERERVALAHARSPGTAWALRRAMTLRRAILSRNVPMVTSFHETFSRAGPLTRFHARALAGGDCITAASNYVRNHILAHYPVGPERIQIMPYGIDPAILAPDRINQTRLVDLIRRWRLPDDRKIILIPEGLSDRRGLADILAALARLGRRTDSLAIIPCADTPNGPRRRAIERRLTKLRLDDTVYLAEPTLDRAAAYMLATVVVTAPRHARINDHVFVDVQALGRPLVASDVGAAREFGVPGKTVWLVPPGNVSDLAAALDEVLGLTERRRRQVLEQAINHIRHRHLKARFCAETLAVYARLLDEQTGTTEVAAPSD